MNHAQRLVMSPLVALAALACGPTVAGPRCAAPAGLIDREACAAAAQGPEALRRFVVRTKGMWNLWYFDYAADDTRVGVAPVPAPSGGEQVAQVDASR